jgi:hypothetical protein
MNVNTKLFKFILPMMLFPCIAFAGAWTQEKGGGFQQVSFTYLKYKGLLNGDDDGSSLKREITDFTLQYYLEYGLHDKLTLLTVLPYKLLSAADKIENIDPEDDLFPNDTTEGGSLNALSNLTFALKYQLYKKNAVLSAQLRLGTATGEYDDPTGLRTGYDSWLITPSLLWGKGYENTYISSEAGFQYKTNDYAHNVLANVELGLKMQWKKTHTWLVVVIDALVPVTEGNYDDQNSVHTGMFQDSEGFVSPGVKINHYLNPNWIVNFGTYGAFWADHGGNSPTLNFGLAYEW